MLLVLLSVSTCNSEHRGTIRSCTSRNTDTNSNRASADTARTAARTSVAAAIAIATAATLAASVTVAASSVVITGRRGTRERLSRDKREGRVDHRHHFMHRGVWVAVKPRVGIVELQRERVYHV